MGIDFAVDSDFGVLCRRWNGAGERQWKGTGKGMVRMKLGGVISLFSNHADRLVVCAEWTSVTVLVLGC